MKEQIIIYNATTGEKEIVEVYVEEIEEIIVENKLTIEERIHVLEYENKNTKEINENQDKLIDTTMLATDEIFTMIEPILDLVPQNISLEGSVSKMVDLYVAMIQRGIKTIEQVPTRYREEVRRILTELEK